LKISPTLGLFIERCLLPKSWQQDWCYSHQRLVRYSEVPPRWRCAQNYQKRVAHETKNTEADDLTLTKILESGSKKA
jgi:hypothetical protein